MISGGVLAAILAAGIGIGCGFKGLHWVFGGLGGGIAGFTASYVCQALGLP